MDELYDKNLVILEEEYSRLLTRLHPNVIRSFDRFLLRKEDDTVKDNIKEQLKLMLYNNRAKVKAIKEGKQYNIKKKEPEAYKYLYGSWLLNAKPIDGRVELKLVHKLMKYNNDITKRYLNINNKKLI